VAGCITGVTVTVFAAAGLLVLDGRFGPYSLGSRRAFALLMLVSLVVSSSGGLIARQQLMANLGLLVTAALVMRGSSLSVGLVAFVAALSIIDLTLARRGLRSMFSGGALLAFMTYVVLGFLAELVPQAGAIGEAVASLGSMYVNRARGLGVHTSFSAIGGPAVLMSVLLLVWSWRCVGGASRLGTAVLLPLAWFALLAVIALAPSAGPGAVFNRAILNGLACLIVTALAVTFLPRAQAKPISPATSRVRWLSLFTACLAAALASVCLTGTSLIGPAAAKTILVHNRGGLDWDRPVFGRFGAFSGGMFGLLPVYCRAEGYAFDVIDKDAIAPADLEKTQILVLINSPKVWSDAERQVILDFMARGGSLLVLGDHTDVFGLMRGFNRLLGPLGIQFRFDSAYKMREGWRGCQAASTDVVAWGWDEENPSVAVGASLELSGSARALLTGRYGFSDLGVRENSIGSFLGNYHYDAGERLGDVVLVATATYGRGRVVVWGDTTAFQGGLSYSYPRVVGPLLAWMSRPAAWTEQPVVRGLAAVGLVFAVVWMWVARASAGQTLAVTVSLLLGLLVPWVLSLPNLDSRVSVAGDSVLIDRTHMPATGHYEARVNPIGPLYTNLLRSGFRVVDMDSWDAKAIGQARGIAFVAPQRSFSAREIDDLLDAEDRGGVVILSVGYPDSAASGGLLAAHGLALAPRPLGTVTAGEPTASRRERERHPRFLDAWPIVRVDDGDPSLLAGVEVIYRQGEDVIALFRRRGKGGLLLISDTRFFSDMNVEDTSGFWPGNLALIHDMFRQYLGADPNVVQPLFRSPEKPR
jgi:hypothetical protein